MTWNENITHGIGFGVANPTQNYANSDEMLLDDRNRPRDEYGFRLQPGRQMSKNDYRQANNAITEYLKIYGGKETSKNTDTEIPLAFDNTGALTLTQTYNSTAEAYEKYMQSTKIGKTSWAVKNGHLVVPETGLYTIVYRVRFDFPSGSSISAAPNGLAKLNNIDNGVSDQIDSAAGSIMFIYGTIIGHTCIEYLKGGTELQLKGHYSTSTSYMCLLRGTIEIMQVS